MSLQHAIRMFSAPPLPNFVVSSLGVRKKNKRGHLVKVDLSRPSGKSVNDSIDQDVFSCRRHFSVNNAVKSVLSAGRAGFMAERDIKHACRLIPVRPSDWHLLGYKIQLNFYFDIVLPFGCGSSLFFSA